MAVASARTQLIDFLGASGGQHQAQGLESFRHFQEATCHTFGGDMMSQVMQTIVAANIWHDAYLTHLVIAVSAGHQRRLLGPSSQTKKLRELRLEELSHWQTGLQLFQAELSCRNPPPGPERMDFDSMVAAMFLTIVFTFATQDGNLEGNVTVGGNDFEQSIITPISSTGGFRALQAIWPGPNENSVWIPVLYAADDANGSFTSKKPGAEGLPPAFVQLCELDHHSTSEMSPYHAILRHLTPLLQMELTPRDMSKLFAFGGRLHRTFRPLAVRKDPRGLLLLSWWLALLRQVDEWWIRAWARHACNLIVAYLSTASDPRIQALLVFPATFGTADFSWIWRDERDYS